jgi:hypothetical protein
VKINETDNVIRWVEQNVGEKGIYLMKSRVLTRVHLMKEQDYKI